MLHTFEANILEILMQVLKPQSAERQKQNYKLQFFHPLV